MLFVVLAVQVISTVCIIVMIVRRKEIRIDSSVPQHKTIPTGVIHLTDEREEKLASRMRNE